MIGKVCLLLMVGFLLGWLIGGMVWEPFNSYGFFVLIVAYFWIIIPGSGAANTFFYMQITKGQGIRS